jgi:hypothetical protein
MTLALLRLVDGRLFWTLASIALRAAAHLAKAPRWTTLAGFALERRGNDEGALKLYSQAASAIQASDDTAALRWLHATRFFMERTKFRLGLPCAEDPLFCCSAAPHGRLPEGTVPAGYYRVEFVFSGLQVLGTLPKGTTEAVNLYLGGRKLRDVNTVSHALHSTFAFKITRRALRLFPKEGELSVSTKEGCPLAPFTGEAGFRLSVPHGAEGAGPLATGERRMDKKGVPVPTAEELAADRDAFLSIYADAREFFRDKLGKHLYLMYGTLLGFHREGGFIPGDDDFDAGFMADAATPEGVKAEAISMVESLVAAGFSVSFNRMGRLFRLHGRGAGFAGPHLDVHSFWVQDGLVWAHNDYCAPGSREDFVPAVEGTLQGKTVYAPARTELFLRTHYGPSWKTPDPGFANYYSAVDPAVLRNLARALITPQEDRETAARIEAARRTNPEAGEFVSIGARDLYPLTGRDEDLE